MNLLSKTSLVAASLVMFEASQPSPVEARDDDHHGGGHAEGRHGGNFHAHDGKWHGGHGWNGGVGGADTIGQPVGLTNCWIDANGVKHCH